MNKKLIPAILGGLGILGISSQALALEIFEINPNSIPGTSGFDSPVKADAISGGTSGRIILDANTKKATESGYVQFDSFKLNANGIDGDITGLGLAGSPNPLKYGLYLTFALEVSYDAANSTGVFGAANSAYKLDSLTYTMWADPDLNTTFTVASTNTNAFHTDNGGEDFALASGSLVSGSATINSDGGVGINATTTFTLTSPEGEAYFINPRPFYEFMFTGANNTGSGVEYDYNNAVGCTTGICNAALINSVLTVDYKGVPEPVTLALFGVGLLGFGASRLRKKA